MIYAPTQQDMVAVFYLAKLGRLPTPYEARVVLGEELYELETALSLDATDEDTLHELADVLYTAYGYAIAKGWNLTAAFERVHAANMTKAATESGKIQRGDAYVPPQLGDLVCSTPSS